MHKPEFHPIKLKKALRNHPDDANYLVYKNQQEFVKVKAGSAFEALEISKVTSPLKIVHIIPDLESFLQEQDLKFVGSEDNMTDLSQDSSELHPEEPKRNSPENKI